MESAQFPSSSQGLKFVLSAVEGQPSDALSVSGVITNVGQLTAARRLTNISGSACLSASRSMWGLTKMTSQFAGALAPLYDMYKKGEKNYSVQRLREGLKQKGKPLFHFYAEQRSLNIMISTSKLRGISHFYITEYFQRKR